MSKRHAASLSQRSLVARIEEIVLASSGADAFELVLALVAARLGGGVDAAAKQWPELEVQRRFDVPKGALAEVERLLDRAAIDGDAEALDAVFEQLVTRVGKGDKGQFFTPRHVVEWIVRCAGVARGERVVDPACGSGAFLVHARAKAACDACGADVDARAVRVARLIAIASRGDPACIARADSLGAPPRALEGADVIVTNPPFAGDARYDGFEVAELLGARRAERDALFVERCVGLLREGGRLAIVLPHNKVAARAWGPLRRWLVERARVLAVVSLARETFLPHTSQKAVVLFAKKRAARVPFASIDRAEKVLFAVSERAGKDAAGEPIVRAGHRGPITWRAIDHDLDVIASPLRAHLEREGFFA